MEFMETLINYIIAILAVIGVLALYLLYRKWEVYCSWQQNYHYNKKVGKFRRKIILLKDFLNETIEKL